MVEEVDQKLWTAHISGTHICEHDGDVTWNLYSRTMMIIRAQSVQHQAAGRLKGLKRRQEGLDSNLATITGGFLNNRRQHQDRRTSQEGRGLPVD